MAWLRVDDGFTKHPKFEGWPPAQRWAWLEVMEYCARYSTKGRIPTDVTILPRAVTAALLRKAEASGWCSRGDDEALWINDWEDFNPPRQTSSELDALVSDALRNHPSASANDLVRLVGGNRKAILSSIRRVKQTAETSGAGGSATGSEVVPESGSELVPGTGSGTSSRTGFARGPAPAYPSRPQELEPEAVMSTQDTDDDPEPIVSTTNGLGSTEELQAKVTDSLRSP